MPTWNSHHLSGNGNRICLQFMSTAKCYGKTNTKKIMIKFATRFSPPCMKHCLVPCLSSIGQALVKELGDWYMTPTGVYIRIAGSTKPPHWLPHFVPDFFLLQEVAYQTFINGVVASLHKHKKGVWPPFPLSTQVGK